MSLGACTTRQFNRVLRCLKLKFIHYHASAYFLTGNASAQHQNALYQDFSTKSRTKPIPGVLPHAEQLRILNHSSEMRSPDFSDNRQQWRLSAPHTNLTTFYLSIRGSIPSVKELNVAAYLQLAREARMNHLQHVMDLLADDLLCHFPRDSDPGGFSKAAIAVLSHATPNCPLTHRRTLELFNALTALDLPQHIVLTPRAWDRLFSAAISHPDLCSFSLESMALMLLSQPPERAQARSIWLTYRIVIEILMKGEGSFPQALVVFQQLIHLGRVPNLAQQLAHDEGGSFKIIIANTLVRACLEYNWYIKAADFIMELLRDPRWSQAQGTSVEDIQATSLLALEVLHVLVRSPTRQEVQTCHKLILAILSQSLSLHQASRPVKIPDADIMAFYETCYDYKLVGYAASIYVKLQSPSIRQHHYYPPPRNSALFWLFDHFADPGVSPAAGSTLYSYKGYIRMARIILNDIIYHGIPVPVVDRPRFIAIAAARGFGFYARQLWEMYTVESDPNRDVVRGNAQMLIPIVKLFRKLQEAWDRGPGLATNQDLKRPGAKLKKDINTTETSNPHKAALYAKKSVLPDAWRFANHVLNSYIVTKLPLAMASQEDLNALARAHLILDHVSEGVEALSVVMERGDIPDVKDINVALVAIARYSPRHAARMLEQMVTRGVGPSASGYSALLHAALKTQDFRLVDILISRARNLGHGALTPKAIAALVQATIKFKCTKNEKERSRQKSNLKVVTEAIEMMVMKGSSTYRRNDHGKDHVLSVKMGQRCIGAALMAMEPELAMRIWRLLVKDRVLWDDKESQSTRTAVGKCIRDRWKHGQLHEEEARGMLDELEIHHMA